MTRFVLQHKDSKEIYGARGGYSGLLFDDKREAQMCQRRAGLEWVPVEVTITIPGQYQPAGDHGNG